MAPVKLSFVKGRFSKTKAWRMNACGLRHLTLRASGYMLGKSCENEKRSFMTITLKPEHEELIAQAIRRGSYQNPDEVIGRALEVLHAEDEWLDDHKGEIAEKIERAFEQFGRGEFFSAEESRAEMERRKATWLREQSR